MNQRKAEREASRRSRLSRHGDCLYVVYIPEDAGYEIATDSDLDTFFAGLGDHHILSAWQNGQRV